MSEIVGTIWVVDVTAMDRFSGPEHLMTKKFTTKEEAADFMREQDTRIGGPTPDFYTKAILRVIS